MDALAYHISFTTYGTRLHGDPRGTVDDAHNISGTPYLAEDTILNEHRAQSLKHPPVILDARMRGATDAAIREVCEYRRWTLYAINVRTNHVHTVVSFADADPEKVMGDFKAYATRRMRKDGIVDSSSRVWTAKGSKRPIWDEDGLARVVYYVEEEQGPDLPMDREPQA
jgi:REP element-mobilizing transposase RayT